MSFVDFVFIALITCGRAHIAKNNAPKIPTYIAQTIYHRTNFCTPVNTFIIYMNIVNTYAYSNVSLKMQGNSIKYVKMFTLIKQTMYTFMASGIK